MGFQLFRIEYIGRAKRRRVTAAGEVPTIQQAREWLRRNAGPKGSGVFFEYTPADLVGQASKVADSADDVTPRDRAVSQSAGRVSL